MTDNNANNRSFGHLNLTLADITLSADSFQNFINNSYSDDFDKNEKKNSRPDDQKRPPVKPSFINYYGNHFEYYGNVKYLMEEMGKIINESGSYFKFNEDIWEYECLSYPDDQKIFYAIQIYDEPNKNCYVIEFRRLDGAGFKYRNVIMNLWKKLKENNIGPGVLDNVRPMMPTLKMEGLDNNYKVKAETILPMLGMVKSNYLNARETGLQMLISATKSSETQDALKETHAMLITKNVLCSSENEEIDRLCAAVLREGIDHHYDDMMGFISLSLIEIVLEKLENNYINEQRIKNFDKKEYEKKKYLIMTMYEVQCNLILILKKLYDLDVNKEHLKTLREKGTHLIISKIIRTTECKRLKNISIELNKLLNPLTSL
jgi:hypothetical protein